MHRASSRNEPRSSHDLMASRNHSHFNGEYLDATLYHTFLGGGVHGQHLFLEGIQIHQIQSKNCVMISVFWGGNFL